MKILTKLMLASAVMVTSGFAGGEPEFGDAVFDGANSSTNLHGNFEQVNYVARNGGKINVDGNTTVPARRSIRIESRGVGTVEEGVVLSNEGTVAMHWADAAADRGLVAGSGKIDQIIVKREPVTIMANFDNTVDAAWYVYNYASTNGVSGVFYSKTSGAIEWPGRSDGWYFQTPNLGEAVYEASGMEDPLGSGSVKSFSQAYIEAKNGSIVINNVEKLEYIAAGSAVLGADTTDLTATALKEKTAKLVSVSGEASFNPAIPSTIADVTLNGEADLLESPAADKITDNTSLANYFSEFGVSFKKADKSTNSDMTYVDAQSVIDAIASGGEDDAVLLNQTEEIAVGELDGSDDFITIKASLHSIGTTTGVTFSGTKGLNLSGNNQLLEKMTADCPVKISGANAMPGKSTFNDGLTIAESVETPSGTTTVTGGFKVERGKTFTVKGELVVGTPI